MLQEQVPLLPTMAAFPRRGPPIGSARLAFHLIEESDAANLLLMFRHTDTKEVLNPFDASINNSRVINPRPSILGRKVSFSPSFEANRRFRAPLVKANESYRSSATDIACVTPPQPPMKVKTLAILEDLRLPSTSVKLTETPLKIRSLKRVDSEEFDSKKHVGQTLPEGKELRDVLRKKFSWKSFPELEQYLIDNRLEYLSCSNSMNYTKAQKLYNNQLTQGLLDLAADSGYIFEGFTFAAVRDRIRCFYKSYVQATKKKKRLKVQKRSRAVSM